LQAVHAFANLHADEDDRDIGHVGGFGCFGRLRFVGRCPAERDVGADEMPN